MHSPVLLSFILLVIGIVILWIIYRFTRSAWLLVIPAALLLYALFDFELYKPLKVLFWVAILVGVVTFVIMLFYWTYSLRSIFRAASATALVIALMALLFGTFSWHDLIFGDGLSSRGLNNGTSATTTVAPSTSNTPSTTLATCPGSWAVVKSDNTNNRWFADGIASIRNAKTEAEARKAAEEWLGKVKTDPVLLSGASTYMLKQQVDPAKLVNGSCMSSDAVTLTRSLELALADASIKVEAAPANGTNSGVAAGSVVIAPASGISGDRSAIKVTLKDGTVVYIMARCGNPVTTSPPKLPPGPTDEQKPVPTTTICASGKCVPPSTLAPPPTTAPMATSTTTSSVTTTTPIPATTWQPPPTSRPDSGIGAPPTSTIVVPTTVAPQATVPATTAPPTTRVSY